MAAGLMLSRVLSDTPLGPLTVLLSQAGVVATFPTEDREEPAAFAERLGATMRRSHPKGRLVREELASYFDGRLRRFETPVDLSTIAAGFPRTVLERTRSIPYGELRTYGDVAAASGSPGAARAAGSALARCPIDLFVPCHRVVRSGPSLGAYGGHDERRRYLLRLEGAMV
ncbi:MAG: methylated-DNA--[protein]-cysteine S-methyltransferase [Actinomycetota bacterium]